MSAGRWTLAGGDPFWNVPTAASGLAYSGRLSYAMRAPNRWLPVRQGSKQ